MQPNFIQESDETVFLYLMPRV